LHEVDSSPSEISKKQAVDGVLMTKKMSKDDYIAQLEAEVQQLITGKARQTAFREMHRSHFEGGKADDNLRLQVK